MKTLAWLLWAFCVTWPASATESKSHHIVVQLAPDGFKPWDPLSSEANVMAFNAAVHRQPLYFSRDYRINAGYVKEWAWDFKRHVYVLTLDAETRFHNGQAIKAADLEFALVKPFITRLDRWEKANLRAIKGIDQLKPGTPYKPGLVAGIKVTGDRTLEIALEQENPLFLYSFSETVPTLGPIDSFQSDLFSPKKVPIGCGHYRVTSSDPKTSQVTVERVDPPSDPAIPLSIDFFSDGSALDHKADLTLGDLMNDPGYKAYTGDVTLGIQVLDFNYSNRFAQDRRYRQAIEMAIDKEAANQGYNFSRVADQLVAAAFYGRAPKKLTYDPAAAKKILQELPADFRKAKHKAYYHGPKDRIPKYLTRIKEQLAKVGLDFEFIRTDQPKMEDKDREVELYIYGQGVSFIDPLNPFSYYLPGGINPNHAPKADKTYTELYHSAFRAPDIETRAAAIVRLTEYCRKQICQIQLFEDRPVFVYGQRIASFGAEKLFLTYDYDLIRISDKDSAK